MLLSQPIEIESAQDGQEHFPEDARSLRSSHAEEIAHQQPVAETHASAHKDASNAIPLLHGPEKDLERKESKTSESNHIYWVTPVTGIGFFLVGLGAALGHHFFLASLNDTPVSNQVWVNRYSLAMAFVDKSSLAAAISLAYAQKLWLTLQQSRRGVTVGAIDALFTAQESLAKMFTFDMWRMAFVAAVIVTIIWLMPLAALISPTALSVGLLTQSTSTLDCVVPTLEMTNQDWQTSTTTLSLSTVDYTGVSYKPSMAARRIVGATCQGGQQLGWASPCGSNCTYNVSFTAPSIRCTRAQNIDDAQAPWTIAKYPFNGSYWFAGYGNGQNYSYADEQTSWDPVYYAGLNANTSQLWAGVSNTFSPVVSQEESVQQGLDIHVYACDFMNSSYSVRTTYTGGQQKNELLDLTHVNRVDIPQYAWEGGTETLGPDALDLVSMYQILVSTINGTIFRDPREILADQTTISLVPTLCTQYNKSSPYGQTELAIPHLEIGPLIEQLSHNISISLLSEQRLQVTNTTTTICVTSTTMTVWKYSLVPLVTAYASAVGLSLLCLVIGAHAMLCAGCARDKTFSSIVRTTRSGELDVLGSVPDNGALPLGKEAERMRLILSAEASGKVAFRPS